MSYLYHVSFYVPVAHVYDFLILCRPQQLVEVWLQIFLCHQNNNSKIAEKTKMEKMLLSIRTREYQLFSSQTKLCKK